MEPYRVSADEDCIHFVVLPSTLLHRLVANFGASRRAFFVVASRGAGWSLLLTGFVAALSHRGAVALDIPYGIIFGGLFAALSGIPLCIHVIRIVIASIEPSTLGGIVMRAITVREEGVVLTPECGSPESMRWTGIAGARDLGQAVELSLAHDRPMKVVLRCDAAILERLRYWLRANRLL